MIEERVSTNVTEGFVTISHGAINRYHKDID